MSEKVKKLPGSKAEATVAVDKEAWKKAQQKAFRKLAGEVTVKGFRKGQAPDNLVRSHIDPDKLFNEAVNAVLPETFGKLVQEEKLRPYNAPQVSVTKASNEELELKFLITLLPEVVLGPHSGLHAEKEAPSVTDGEIDADIQKRLQAAATLEVVDREAKLGDTVVLDFEGYVDGKPFDGGKAENYSLELGSHSFVPGFEEALVGVKTGEKKDVEITFPENYIKELASKPAKFVCKIHEIKEKKIPSLDDEAVKDFAIPGVETVDALKEKTKSDLLTQKVNEAQGKYLDAILAQIVEGSKIELAEEIIHQEAHSQLDGLKKRIEDQGLTFAQYLEITGSKEEDLHDQFMAQAKSTLTSFLVTQQIAIDEKLTVTQDDIKAEYQRMADLYKMKVEDVEKALKPQQDRLVEQLRNKKIQDWLLANNA